ncbi:LOW QUALITY PROTEIN: hypothetical protein CVT25_008818 [Psilocybe cyanescens]|uniref:Uncharacterized protein n=1 Tax=Psilocybe cyanescens TaxID=93625 RepID=A0A409W0Z5_PSICY|nr:LOW QUALITY PROTEIN: hypothetical protein CVT25_008818 [Psilocybe cyanescens]
MSTTDIPIPVNVQDGIIRANLNSSMLLNVLMALQAHVHWSGIYSLVYAGTMYLYVSKKISHSPNHRIVLSAMSLLYLLCFSEFVVQWYFLNWAIVSNGDTRESIFLETVGGGPPWIFVLDDFLFFAALIVSDGLLVGNYKYIINQRRMIYVWRCFNIWGRSFRVISVPLALLVAEFVLRIKDSPILLMTYLVIAGLFCAVMILAGLSTNISTDPDPNLFNRAESALTFISLGSTVVSTFLIGYRIHFSPSSNLNVSSSSLQRVFNHIWILIVESAAIYSLVLLLDAISIVVPSFGELGSPWAEAEYYIESVLIPVAGMAPTILVARLALTNTDSMIAGSTITRVSNLQFKSQIGSSSLSANKFGDDSAVVEEKMESLHGDHRV